MLRPRFFLGKNAFHQSSLGTKAKKRTFPHICGDSNIGSYGVITKQMWLQPKICGHINTSVSICTYKHE